MSDEIQLNVLMKLTNGNVTDAFSERISMDQAAVGKVGQIQVIGTTAENVYAGDLGTNGLFCCKNLDATNYIDLGLDDSGTIKACIRLKPGNVAVFPVKPGISLRAQANTAACKLSYLWLEA